MATVTFSQEELQRDFAAADEATHAGPVLITKDGKPRLVLLDIAKYRKLTGAALEPPLLPGQTLAESLAVPEDEYFEWEPPIPKLGLKPADLS